MRRLPIVAGLLLALPAYSSAADYASPGYSVLAPGQHGNIPVTKNSTDQIKLYDGLTPLRGNVKAADLAKYYKPNVFGTRGQGKTTVEKTTNKRVRIVLDKWGVPHITAKKREDVFFAVGWMFAKERHLLLEVARGPGRLAVLDPPGVNAFALVAGVRIFEPSAEADAIVLRQVDLLKQSEKGRRLLKDIDAYVRGINAQYKRVGREVAPWKRVDFLAISAFIGSIFGRGGGNEANNAMFLDALQTRLGPGPGEDVWNDLRNLNDPESSVSVAKRAPYGATPQSHGGSVVLDNGSFEPTPAATLGRQADAPVPDQMSNALLVAAKRSRTKRPLFVAGPQIGYFYPELVYEVDMHSQDGIDARGLTTTGAGPYVFIGRGQDFAWSLTSAGNDIIDHYVETLCGGSVTKYMHDGECRDMTSVNAGVLKGSPDQVVAWNETVHGPVIGYATVGGTRVAISEKRSTRGREALSLAFFQDLNTNKVTSAKQFLKAAPQFEHTFNIFFADERDIAMYSSGRMPIRPDDVDPGLPTEGTGGHEWRGFIAGKAHPQQINPPSGLILNWNNRPAPGWASADDNWTYGSVHRNDLFTDLIAERSKHTLASVVSVMNEAATQDLRSEELTDLISDVLAGAPAPSPRAEQMRLLLADWRATGSSRLDADGDGKIDHAGAAVMDAVWLRLADAVLDPALGDLKEQLRTTIRSSHDEPASGGSAFGGGWYSYVDKDLRSLLGRDVDGPYSRKYCGSGVLATCAAALWDAFEKAGAELAEAQGNDPAEWRADATAERIRFAPNLINNSMRWTNRPTYQQAISFRGGRR